MKREIVCFCEHRFDADPPEEVDLARSPELEEAILAGSFMTAKCPRCGRLLKPEHPVRVRDAGRGIDLFMIPEEDRREYLHGASPPGSGGGAARVVIGYAELLEALQAVRCGLDARALEVVKYYLLNRALQEVERDGGGGPRPAGRRAAGRVLCPGGGGDPALPRPRAEGR